MTWKLNAEWQVIEFLQQKPYFLIDRVDWQRITAEKQQKRTGEREREKEGQSSIA